MDIQQTLRRFFPAMKIHETMLHILYAKQNKDGVIEPSNRMNMDYSGVISDLIKMGLIKRDDGNLKFTELGKEKITYLREMRGLTEESSK